MYRHTVTMEISSAIPWLNAVRSVTQHSPKLCCWASSKNLKNYWTIMMELLILTPRTLQLSRYCFESFWLLLYIVIRVATGQEMVKGKYFFLVWEESGNFILSQGNFTFWRKVRAKLKYWIFNMAKLIPLKYDKDYNKDETVFHLDIQTPRRELKTQCAAEYFWWNIRCLDS